MKQSNTIFVVVMTLFCLLSSMARAQTPVFINGPGSTLSQTPRTNVPHTPRLPYGLQLMARFDLLPLLRETKCVQDSSYDRSGGNGDSGNFVRREGNKAVLADIRGPGCIYRFWSANAAGNLQIFFDGETTPRIACPLQDLFTGKVAPFVAPLVGHKSGGWYCFFPMPFQKSCRLEVTDPGSLYYHVEYQLFPDKSKIRTFTPQLTRSDQKALDTISAQWNRLGDDPKPPTRERTLAGTGDLAPGATRILATLQGAKEIGSLRLHLAPADRNTLRQTVLRVYWEGADRPGIEAPVGDFFGVGFGDNHFAALPDALTPEGGVCYWPMPFQKSCRIEVTNYGATPIGSMDWSLSYHNLRGSMRDKGYFHAQWHRQTTVAGEHFHILQTTGRGHYVGEHTDMQGDRGIWFLEGDEKFYADGETFPSIYGTGTEDFYTGGWYFDEGPFALAYHGCTVKSDAMSRVSAYRYQIQDCVPFQQDLKVDIEHGGVNDYPGADYACVAYWYQDSPSHAWSPIDPAQLTPAHPTLAGVIEAESLTWTNGNHEIRSDSGLAAEASGGKFVAASGLNPTFTLDVEKDDNYTLVLSNLLTPDSALALHLRVDGAGGHRQDYDLFNNPDGGSAAARQIVRLTKGVHTFELFLPSDRLLNLDYIRLEPSRKEAGVTEAEDLPLPAEAVATTRRIDAAPLYSGYSALRFHKRLPTDALELPFEVAGEGDFAVTAALETTGITELTAQVDSLPPVTIPRVRGGYGPVRFGDRYNLKAGKHSLRLSYTPTAEGEKNAALIVDYLRLKRVRYANSVEAESLKVLDAKDGQAQVQELGGFSGEWSGDAQFWFLGQKAGAEATLELPVATTGRYELSVYYTSAPDYATVQVLIDGNPVGAPTDTYTPGVRAMGKIALGTLDLTAGAHRITFRAAGKNLTSTGYLIGVDAIGLEPKTP